VNIKQEAYTCLLVHSSASLGISESKSGLKRASGAATCEKTLGNFILTMRLLLSSALFPSVGSFESLGLPMVESTFGKVLNIFPELSSEW